MCHLVGFYGYLFIKVCKVVETFAQGVVVDILLFYRFSLELMQ